MDNKMLWAIIFVLSILLFSAFTKIRYLTSSLIKLQDKNFKDIGALNTRVRELTERVDTLEVHTKWYENRIDKNIEFIMEIKSDK